MSRFLAVFSLSPGESRKHGGDTTSDRLSSVYTVKILMAFAAFTQFSQIFGRPVECWCPAHFTDTHESYANTACWTSNTYYLNNTSPIPPAEDQKKQYVTYYQWVGLVLTFQAAAFLVPRQLWRTVNALSGVAVSTITDAAMECQLARPQRDKSVDYMVQHIDRFLSKLGVGVVDRCRGHYLPLVYLLVKLLYLGNVIAQLFVVNKFLGIENYSVFGFQLLSKMAKGEPWLNTNYFPRVTLCDLSIRLLGNVNRYTIQCSLPMNLFNEIIYIFLWFWFVFVAAVTAGSALVWGVQLIVPHFDHKFVRKRLVAKKRVIKGHDNHEVVRRFVSNYLKGDGCFLLRMVQKNAGEMVASEILVGLWDKLLEAGRSSDRRDNQGMVPSNSAPSVSDSREVTAGPSTQREEQEVASTSRISPQQGCEDNSRVSDTKPKEDQDMTPPSGETSQGLIPTRSKMPSDKRPRKKKSNSSRQQATTRSESPSTDEKPRETDEPPDRTEPSADRNILPRTHPSGYYYARGGLRARSLRRQTSTDRDDQDNKSQLARRPIASRDDSERIEKNLDLDEGDGTNAQWPSRPSPASEEESSV